MSTGKAAQAYHVNVFLYGRIGNLFRGVVASGVNHLKACVAETSGQNLGSAVMSIKSRFGEQYTDLLCH
jgi:hypothetical protein